MPNITPKIPNIISGDWNSVVKFGTDVQRAIHKLGSFELGTGSSPTFSSITFTGLTANRLVSSDSTKKLASVTDLTSWIAGTANEINITDDGDGTVTIGIVDPLIVGKGGTGAATLTDHGILLGSGTDAITPLGVATNGQLPIGSTGADPVLATLTGTTNRVTVTNGAGTITLSGPQDIHTAASPTFASLTLNGTATYGLDTSGGTWANGDLNLAAVAKMYAGGLRFLKVDDANSNLFYGTQSFLNDDGQYNVGVGYRSGYNNTTVGVAQSGKYNVYIGHSAGGTVTGLNSGYSNVALGYAALARNTTGNTNIALGANSLNSNTTGEENLAVGYQAMWLNLDGTLNVAIGSNALYSNVSGSYNVAIGKNALWNNTGSSNFAFGRNALFTLTSGIRNVAMGEAALFYNSTGDSNVAIGYRSGFGTSAAACGNNVFIGYQSAYTISTGSNNLFLGYRSGYNQTTNSNLLIIDNQDRTSAALELTNSLIYGVFNAAPASQTLRFNAAVTIPYGLTVDTDTLFVDSATHSVTIGHLTPPTSHKLSSNGRISSYRSDNDGVFTAWRLDATPTANDLLGSLEFSLSISGDPADGAGSYAAIKGYYEGVDLSSLSFLTKNTTVQERMSIDQNGLVVINGLTASRLLATDGSKGLSSVSDLTAWIAGTANQVTVTSDGDGTVTLAGPQNLHTAATPTFGGIIIANGGTIGQAAGPLLTFNDTDNQLGITGCKVGIGTNTPSFYLTISQSMDDLLLLQSSRNVAVLSLCKLYNNRGAANVTVGDVSGIRFDHDTSGGSVMSARLESVVENIAVTTGLGIAIRTGGLAAGNERLRITSAGLVLINKTSGTERLEVNGKIRADTAFNVNGTDGISNSSAGVPTSLTVSGGIVTAISRSGTAKFGDGGSSNYSEFEADGTLKFNGTATVFNDINVSAMQLTLPVATQPDEVNFVDELGADTGITTWGFAVNELVSGSIEIPHDYKEGSDLTFHVHWQGIAAPAGGTDNVKWELTYTVAKGGGTTLDAVTVITSETAITTRYGFYRTDFTAITGTNFDIEDQFLFKLKRVAASADEYAGDALVATIGLHYECDTVGSRTITTK